MRLIRSVAAAIAIAAVLVGVPVAIWWLAAPQVTDVIDGRSIVDALLRPDDGALLLTVLALVAVVAWLVLAVSIIWELGAAALHRPSPRVPIPGFRLAGAVAAALVAALLGSSQALADSGTTPSPAAVVVETDAAAPAEAPPVPGPEYVVAPRDSLWRIADERLGDGLRWREIFDLNAGRMQADGGRLSDDSMLTPGWILTLPSDASISVTVASGDTLRDIAARKLGDADRADELFDLNEGAPQTDGASLTSPEKIRPGWTLRLPDQQTPPPSFTPPGGAPSPTPPPDRTTVHRPVAPTPSTTRPPTPPSTTDPPPPSRTAEPAAPAASSTVVTVVGLTAAVATASLVLLAIRRRRQLRHRPHGHRVAVPGDDAGRLEWAAEQIGGGAITDDRLDLALRSLVHPDLRPDPVPYVCGIERTGTTARIRLLEAASLPAPFEPSDGSAVWDLDLDTPLAVSDAEVAGYGNPYPTLVSIGVEDERTLLIDLEQHRLLRIDGDEARVRALLRHIAAELATSSAAEDVETVVVGLGDGAEDFNPDRIVVAADVDTAIAQLERHAITTRMELSRHGLATTVEGRLKHNSASAWLPTVLLVARPPTPQDLTRLDELLDEATAGATGVAVVAFDPAEPDLRIDDTGALSSDLRGVDGWQAVQLPDDEGDDLADLLGTTDDPAVPAGPADGDHPWSTGMNEDGSLGAAGADVDDDTDGPPTPRPPADEGRRATTADPDAVRRLAIVDHQDPQLDDDVSAWWSDDGPTVPMIAILGEPTVRGVGARPNTRPSWFAEVLVYLCLHPAGVTQAKAATDLWPDGHRISPATIRHAFYGARRWAGRGFGGDPGATFVSDLQNDNSYRLRGHLLDWDLFRRLRKRAQARHSAAHSGAAADYRSALDLVRGPVLGSLRPGGYAWLNNHDQRHDLQIPGFVVDTAHELVNIALTVGDLDLARWAAERARVVDVDVAFDRPLTDLMRIAHAEDNRAELELYGSILLDARGFDVPEELAPESFTILNDLLPSGPRRSRS